MTKVMEGEVDLIETAKADSELNLDKVYQTRCSAQGNDDQFHSSLPPRAERVLLIYMVVLRLRWGFLQPGRSLQSFLLLSFLISARHIP